jgi:uncharacterized protein (DUF433 family)
MQLEDLFEFQKLPSGGERIRFRGHRISLEHVIWPYKNEGASPEDIVSSYYPSLSLEEVYTAIAYYLRNRDAVDEYLAKTEAAEDKAYQDYLAAGPSDLVKRLKAIRDSRQQAKRAS